MAKGVIDAKGFEENARQMSRGLEAYKRFQEQITGTHRPLQYNTKADSEDTIAKLVTESVGARSNAYLFQCST